MTTRFGTVGITYDLQDHFGIVVGKKPDWNGLKRKWEKRNWRNIDNSFENFAMNWRKESGI